MGGSQRQRTGTRTVRARQVGQDGPRDMTGGEEGFLAQPQSWQRAENKPQGIPQRGKPKSEISMTELVAQRRAKQTESDEEVKRRLISRIKEREARSQRNSES